MGPLGKDVTSAVRYQLNKWKKDGWNYPEQEYNAAKSDKERRSFVQKLSLDPKGAWLSMKETETMGESQVNTGLKGFIALWEIAKLEGLTYDPGNEHCMGLLLGMTKDCEQKPHPKQALAEAGHFVYKYEKKLMDRTSKMRSKTPQLIYPP